MLCWKQEKQDYKEQSNDGLINLDKDISLWEEILIGRCKRKLFWRWGERDVMNSQILLEFSIHHTNHSFLKAKIVNRVWPKKFRRNKSSHPNWQNLLNQLLRLFTSPSSFFQHWKYHEKFTSTSNCEPTWWLFGVDFQENIYASGIQVVVLYFQEWEGREKMRIKLLEGKE